MLRGPASALYGSDALAGVVNLQLLSPEDLLKGRKQAAASASLGHHSLDNSRVATLAGAAQWGQQQGLLHLSQREGEAPANGGRSAPDPQQVQSDNALAKWHWHLGDAQLFGATLERWTRDTDTQVRRASLSPGTQLRHWHTRDEQSRERVGLFYDQRFDEGSVERFHAQVDRQESVLSQWGLQVTDAKSVGTALRETEFFPQTQDSASVLLGGQIASAAGHHEWLIGVDWLQRDLSRLTDKLSRNLNTGAETTLITGIRHPGKQFPDTDTRQTGVFVQDSWSLGDFLISPGLRYDRFENRVAPDALYANFNIGKVAVHDTEDSALSPRLGVVWLLNAQHSLFLNATTGFRAPSTSQTFGARGILIPFGAHEVLPNPKLQAETSRGLELGLRGGDARFHYELALFDNRYEDFIASVTVGFRTQAPMFTGPNAIRQLQAQNVERARIHGAEARLDWTLPSNFPLQILAAASHTRGKNESSGAALPNIDPDRLVLGLRHAKADHYRVELSFMAADAVKHAPHISAQGKTFAPYKAKGYSVWDLSGSWSFTPTLHLDAGIYNLLDRRYRDWQDVAGLPINADAELLERAISAGRQVGASLRVEF